MPMKYRLRTILIILTWVILTMAVAFAALNYGYGRSVETATQTIKVSLEKVNGSIEDLIDNELQIRDRYDQTCADMGLMIPFLQEKGLEEDVPSKAHLEKYAQLLGANYIAIIDPDGKTAASSGKYVKAKHENRFGLEYESIDRETSADALVSPEEDYSLIEQPSHGGYKLRYQISNEETNVVQNDIFSWRAILEDMTLPNEAYFVVISQDDDTILVHPDKEKLGKSYDAIGFKTKEDFLDAYEKPDADGICYQKDMRDLLTAGRTYSDLLYSEINLMGRGSGYMEMGNLYVICNMPENMSVFYVLQQRGALIIFVLASLLVMCYVLLRFRWQRRQEKEAPEERENVIVGSRFGFLYERVWSRRLIVCCIIVLALSAVTAVHMELLSSSSQMKIQSNQTEQTMKAVVRLNKDNQTRLDLWFNDTNMRMAQVIAYTLTRDEKLQTRGTIKDAANVFDVSDIYIFNQNGKMRVTNSDYDHIDLNNDPPPRMASTFLPLLYGLRQNAATETTEKYMESGEGETGKDSGSGASGSGQSNLFDETGIAYAGVSIRNSKDLCDGALGIETMSLTELWDSDGLTWGDTFALMMKMARVGDGDQMVVLTNSQMTLILIMLLCLLLSMVAFYAFGVLRRKPDPMPAEGAAPDGSADPDKVEKVGENDDGAADGSDDAASASTAAAPAGAVAAPADIASASASAASAAGSRDAKQTAEEHEDLFYSLYGKEKDRSFNDRWNYDNLPLRLRSPEKQLLFIIRCVLVLLFLNILVLYLSRNFVVDDNSMLRDVISGEWERGFNLYAITATEMIIVVAVVLCMGLRRLIYYAARFSTPRGETVCHLIYSMIMYAAVLVTLYYSLSAFGVHTKTILAGAGILGIVISFGAQSTIADILSGMFLIFEDVIHVGDYVQVGENIGIVKSIGVRMTRIQSFGTEISVNNADLKPMLNMSSSDALAFCLLPVDRSENLEWVEEVIRRELPGITERLDETGYITTDIQYKDVESLSEAGMVLRFQVFCIFYRKALVQRQLTAELIRMCQRNGIALATSHTTIDNIGQPAAQVSAPGEPESPGAGPSAQPALSDRRKGFIDRLVDKADQENGK